MTASASTQGVYVNVPAVDWSLFRELIRGAMGSGTIAPSDSSAPRASGHYPQR